MTKSLKNKNILLVISGGIAAYKALELIRLIKKDGGTVRCILTKGGAQFITPLSVSALSEEQAYTDLWSLKDETEMGHIRLSREADLIVVAPASASLIGKLAHGIADDLASTTLLAADKPIMIAPAMNHKMWDNEAVQDNIRTLNARGILQTGPEEGDMACGEHGLGRMSEAEDIFAAIQSFFFEKPLEGYKALVTAGPTFEPVDPVRFIGNRSSGKQGYEIAQALSVAGAEVTLISGPTALPALGGMELINVETAEEMLMASINALPADIAVCTAAVSDWAPQESQAHKIKKRDDKTPPAIQLQENPDILKTLATHKQRPDLVIGFAAETENLIENAKEKRLRKQCDWILANNVRTGENIFGGDENHVYLVTEDESEEWERSSKQAVAKKLIQTITEHLERNEHTKQAAE